MVDIGSSYCLSEINAAFLYTQLKQARDITNKRIKIWNIYNNFFKKLEIKYKVLRPHITKNASINGHSFFILTKKNIRNKLLNYLNNNKIMALFHYIPLHNSPFGKKLFKIPHNLKNTNSGSASIIRMPMHLYLNKKDIKHISTKVIEFFEKNKR